VSAPGDPVVMYADIEGESDNPSPIGWEGRGAAVAEPNMPLSLTCKVFPRLSEIISADSPNSSADTPNGRGGGGVKCAIWRKGSVLTCEKRHVVTLVHRNSY
jgi:hypothetical protein